MVKMAASSNPLNAARNRRIASRLSLLLFASLFFYAWGSSSHLILLIFSILLNYTTGIAIDRTDSSIKAKIYLGLGIAANLLLLGYFRD